MAPLLATGEGKHHATQTRAISLLSMVAGIG